MAMKFTIPPALRSCARELLAGQYDEWWVLFGNVLNCTAVDTRRWYGRGYLAPPCRSMTKLYNFNLITGWAGAVTHVLANGTVEFKPGYDASRRWICTRICPGTARTIAACIPVSFRAVRWTAVRPRRGPMSRKIIAAE